MNYDSSTKGSACETLVPPEDLSSVDEKVICVRVQRLITNLKESLKFEQ